MTDRYVVIGNPISHSMSPAIHADFARQVGLQIQYRRWYSPLDGFAQTVRALKACGVAGANVTVPFKHEAAALADQPSEDVRFTGAANTLRFMADGSIQAHNTDGLGLCRDLNRLLGQQSLTLADVELVMLGAGGAAKGCVPAFEANGVKSLTIMNRTANKAVDLATSASSLGLTSQGGGLDLPASGTPLPRVIVNASSSSLNGEVPVIDPKWWQGAVLALDMMYGAKPTPFMRAASINKVGVAVADGLGMLVNQAAYAFEIWTGQKPDADSTLERMRQTLTLKA